MPCAAPEDAVPWSAERRVAITEAWSAADAHQRRALTDVLRRIDAQADALRLATAQVCQDDPPDAPGRTAALACLEEQTAALAVAASGLEGSPEGDPRRLVSDWRAPGTCLTAEPSLRAVPAPGIAEEVSDLRARLERADRARFAGDGAEARSLAAEVVTAAHRLPFAPLELRARLTQLKTHPLRDRTARRRIEAIVSDCIAQGEDVTAILALFALAPRVAAIGGQAEPGLSLLELAGALIDRRRLDPRLHEALDRRRAEVYAAAGQAADAVAWYDDGGRSHAAFDFGSRQAVAASLLEVGRTAEATAMAAELLRRATEIWGSHSDYAEAGRALLADARALPP